MIFLKYLFAVLSVFSVLQAHESEQPLVSSSLTETEAEKLKSCLLFGFEEILKEDYYQALKKFEFVSQVLMQEKSNLSFEFFLHFGLIIAYDNLDFCFERDQSIDQLVNCIGMFKELSRISPNMKEPLDLSIEKSELPKVLAILCSQAKSFQTLEFLSLVLQDIKLNSVNTILTNSELISTRAFWNKEGWLERLLEKLEEFVDATVRIIVCYNKLDNAINNK